MITMNDTPTYQFFVYEDKAKQWRWRLVADNNKTVADSGEGYVSKSNCHRAIATVKTSIADASIVDAVLTNS